MWLLIAEFAYNNSVHLVTLITPFKAYHEADPNRLKWPGMPLGKGELLIGRGFAAYVLNLQAKCRRKILASNAY
jgi:hypothetical protein